MNKFNGIKCDGNKVRSTFKLDEMNCSGTGCVCVCMCVCVCVHVSRAHDVKKGMMQTEMALTNTCVQKRGGIQCILHSQTTSGVLNSFLGTDHRKHAKLG